VLRKVAEKMRAGCDGCDIARWGGEEFLILSSDDPGTFKDKLEKMRSSIGGEPVVFEDMEINVTVTVGMASRVKAQSIDEWIQCVDKKLYIGKTSGKNRIIE
jgi:diguanylate cyclase (GGDEF)-like protein